MNRPLGPEDTPADPKKKPAVDREHPAPPSSAGSAADAQDGASPRALESARSFLSALFMALRTAQIHDSANKAFDTAVRSVRDAAEALFNTAGAFTIQFVEDTAFLNGTRIRFEGGAFESMRKLRRILESNELGGVTMSTRPSPEAVRKLILLFAPKTSAEARVSAEDLSQLRIGLLGVQRFADGDRAGLKIDRRVFALQCYGKLLLALREQRQRVAAENQAAPETQGSRAPRLRAVRIVQDLVELAADRADFLLRLALNRKGAPAEELHGCNTALLCIALGQALGLERKDLVDLGVAGLFHDVTRFLPDTGSDASSTHTSFVRLLSAGGHTRSGFLRALLVHEQSFLPQGCFSWGALRHTPHPMARILAVAAAYSEAVLGLADGEPQDPIEVLGRLRDESSGRFDRRLVDLLINLFRAFPVGTDVVLDTGERATVMSHAGGSRWDRPIVRVHGNSPRQIDLMKREAERFLLRVVETVPKLEGDPESPGASRRSASGTDLRIVQGTEGNRPPNEPTPVTAAPLLPISLPPDALTEDVKTPESTRRLALDRTGGAIATPKGPENREPITFVEELELIEPTPGERRAPALPTDPGVGPIRTLDEDFSELSRREEPTDQLLVDFPKEITKDESREQQGSEEKIRGATATEDGVASERAAGEIEEGAAPITLFGYEVSPKAIACGAHLEYLGIDPHDRTPISLRVIDPAAITDTRLTPERWIELFEREGVIASTISHPGLPRLLDAGKTPDQRRFAVFERPLGAPLAVAQARGEIRKPSLIRRIIRAAAEALHHLHERGVLHCNLNSSNVWLSTELHTSVVDLSLACGIKGNVHPLLATSDAVLAPEVLGGSKFSPRSDQYALGVLLYELLSGFNPYPKAPKSKGTILPKLEPPHTLEPSADPLLSEIAMRLLAEHPKDRFESCDAVARHLSRATLLRRRADLRRGAGGEPATNN